MIGRTDRRRSVALKLTLLNPNTTRGGLDALLDLISAERDRQLHAAHVAGRVAHGAGDQDGLGPAPGLGSGASAAASDPARAIERRTTGPLSVA